MNFYSEHLDTDGKLCSMVHNIPSRPNENVPEVRKSFSYLYGVLCAKKKWTSPKGWHPDFPQSEQMKRINEVKRINGEPAQYSSQQIADADKPRANIVIAHFDKDGRPIPSLEVPPLGLTQISDIADASPLAADVQAVDVEDMGLAASHASLPPGAAGVPVTPIQHV